MRPNYSGTLRPKITILGEELLKIEWIHESEGRIDEIIWTETIKVKAGCSAVSQVVCSGHFEPKPGYFMDENGLRHFVMACDPGELGVLGHHAKLSLGVGK